MISTPHGLANRAVRAALLLVIAGTFVVSATGAAASTDSDASRTTKIWTPQGVQEYPNPEYPNHKPLRGNYPGSYPSTPPTPASSPSDRSDWLAAGAGAGAMLGLILVLTAGKAARRVARTRKDGIPFVTDVCDDVPSDRETSK
jgi:hypothetical protein